MYRRALDCRWASCSLTSGWSKAVGDHTGSVGDTADFVLRDVLDTFEFSDSGAVVTIVDSRGTRLRLHVTATTAERLCEHIAEALERRYGR
jgi:hypothetical protein